MEYKKTVPEVLKELLTDKLGKNKFKEIFLGDPIIIAKSYLPCIIISEPNTDYELGPTGHQDITHDILIQVAYNKADDFGKPAHEATLELQIDHDIQGRDATTGDFLDSSIIGILLRNITLNNMVLEMVPKVEKGVLPRSEELSTVEGHIRCTISEIQAIANRV